MYEVRAAGVKGLGVFATQLISRGTRILSERALLTIPHRGDGAGAGAVLHGLGALSLLQKGALLALSRGAPRRDVAMLRWGQVAWHRTLAAFGALWPRFDAHAPTPPETPGFALRIGEHVQILAIFRSNAFDIGADRQAVFPRIARINHSCVPNAQGHFHEGLGKLNIHATRDILGGEEVMISYLKETGVALRSQRRAKLLEGYGFDCDCPACDAGSERGREGERRRMEALLRLAEYAEKATERGAAQQDTGGELAMMMAMVKLFERQGLTGRGLAI